jgi:hypothetical protein
MRRIFGILAALLIALLFTVPSALAFNGSLAHNGRVLISIGGDATLPAGEHADAFIVVNGTATVAGEANTVVVVDGAANFLGATTESVVAVSSPVNLGPGTVVLGDVRTLDGSVTRDPSVTVGGTVGDLSVDLAAVGFVLAGAFLLIWIGFGIATIAAALVAAALWARQLRAAGALISREPVTSFLVGVGGVVLVPILATAAIITILGAPLGIGILLFALPFVGFVGYLVAAVWVGDLVLTRVFNRAPGERPYLASAVGVIVLGIAGLVPLLSAIATLFGSGAVLVTAWRTFRGPEVATRATGHLPAPMGA